MRILPVAVVATLLTLLLGSTAAAEDFCVAKPRCTGTAVTAAQFKARLVAAQSNGEADRFFLGATTIANGPFAYSSAEPVELHGAGSGTTTLQSAVVGRTVLTLAGRAASAVDLRVELALDATSGVSLSGAAGRNLTVVQMLGTSTGSGVMVNDGGTLADSSVAVGAGSAPAVGTSSGSGTVSGSTLSSQQAGVMTAGRGVELTVTRSTIVAPFGATAFAGTLSIADTLIDGRGAGPISAGLAAFGQGGEVATIHATRMTLVGWSATSTNAVGVYASSTSGTSTIDVTDTAITGVGVAALRTADPGVAANVRLDWTAHRDPIGTPPDYGAGAITETHRLPEPTGFADAAAGVFSLLPGSSLIDAGNPAGASAPAALDRAGAPRLDDGDGDCVARHDVGAYEYQRQVPRAVATASAASTTTGGTLTFSAAGSCDPEPGEALSYAWRFDDGAVAHGAEVQHAFAAAGRHTATVTVTDQGGHAAEASVSVDVAGLGPSGPAGPGAPGRPAPAPKPGRDRVAPTLSALRVPARITRGNALPRLGASRRVPAIAFQLSERSSVRLRFARRGRGGRYRAISPPLVVSARSGANRLRFSGRLTRRARLARGSYRVTLTAIDAAGNRSRAVTGSFRVVNAVGRKVR